MAKEITLTRGKVAVVDDSDYEWLVAHNWQAIPNRHKGLKVVWYAARAVTITRRGGTRQTRPKQRTLFMHREILNALAGEEIDHRDLNGLNNQRFNLRRCTHNQNQANRSPIQGCVSKFKGVTWSKGRNKWQANIYPNGAQLYLGRFEVEEDAARAYDAAAKQYYGEFARLNFPEVSNG